MSFENVSVREAHEKQGQGYTYVDVRSIPEFEQGHPAGAVNVPLLHRDGRSGQMPAHGERLGADKIHVVAAYVYSLSRSP